jgi:trans-2,3-dihydro-3-hydroxyanthranilate isomerase
MLAYDVVDVFTDRPFAGNQLAVVHGGEDLTTEQCLALTREFNYSETAFPVVGDGASYFLRIFTPGAEVPFAGHPTLGTAWVLRERGLVGESEVVQNCGAGPVGVRFHDDGAVELSAAPRDSGGPLDDELAAALLEDVGLSICDAAGPAWLSGAGLSFVHLPVGADSVGRARASHRPLEEYADRFAAAGAPADPVEGVNVHHVCGDAPELRVHARVFVPGLGVAEDPATGSAAAALGIALVASGRLPEGGRYEIAQGGEMGRPSRLSGRVEADAGAATRCHVSGRVQQVASGRITVPPR